MSIPETILIKVNFLQNHNRKINHKSIHNLAATISRPAALGPVLQNFLKNTAG
jgi:hypothetical protein